MTKIVNDTDLKKIEGEKVVLAGGCFDVIHQGHIQFLKNSRKQGKRFVLFLESDENIRKLKGEERPLNNQSIRAENLSKTGLVDIIILLQTPTSSEYYYNLVKSLEPDIIAVTVGDPQIEDKKRQADLVGAKVVEVMRRDKNFSTTKMIEKGSGKYKPSTNS